MATTCPKAEPLSGEVSEGPATPQKGTDRAAVKSSSAALTTASVSPQMRERSNTAECEVEASRGAEVKEGLGIFKPKGDIQTKENNILDVAADEIPLPVFDKAVFLLNPIEKIPTECAILDHDLALLSKGHHADPFAVLGPQLVKTATHGAVLLVRAWVKDATAVTLRTLASTEFDLPTPTPLKHNDHFLFEGVFSIKTAATGAAATPDLGTHPIHYDLEVTPVTGEKKVVRDPYSFRQVLASEYDLKLFQSGSCWHVDNLMGGHIVLLDGATGVRFVVWAPNAVFMSVVGDWNAWDAKAHPMRRRPEFGCWELFLTEAEAKMKYGYRVHTKKGVDIIKIDPYAQEFENPPAHASVISACDDAYRQPEDRFSWSDSEWMAKRAALAKNDMIRRIPMAIYEVHLPSWVRGDGNTHLGYRELADRLVGHCKKMNFTHVEFLPLAHHPFEGSWGYQITGQFAPYSRLGDADDLKFLINILHENDIGVFIDFVPAHFCKDAWGLVHYDGEPCYEYADPREGEHKTWGTMVFNFRRNEVRSFLLGAAYHWLRRYHVDGLRIDAVSSMLYKNHCREPGEWLPNEFGGDANLQAISLLQELNWVVHKEFPGIFTMAEESTSWKGVTDCEKGLGFDAKWDLGWMNDSLAYLCTPTAQRPEKHNKLTFRGMYLGNERWVLPLSHDEVVSGKGSLLDKCGFKGAPFEERVRTLRALLAFQVGMPGRPLLFMGCEFGQGREWKELRSIDWHEAEEPLREKLQLWTSDLFAVYGYHKALHAGDDEVWNFQWVDCDNAADCLVAWIRRYAEWYNDVICIVNFSGVAYNRYPVGVPHGGEWEVLLNSDDWRYGGSMHGPGNMTKVHTTQGGRLGWPYCLWLDIPSFGAIFLKAPQPTKEQIATWKAEEAAKTLEEEKAAAAKAATVKSQLKTSATVARK